MAGFTLQKIEGTYVELLLCLFLYSQKAWGWQGEEAVLVEFCNSGSLPWINLIHALSVRYFNLD